MLSHSVYKNENTSKWVTFIHGAGGSSSIWFQQFRAFKNEFNILFLHLYDIYLYAFRLISKAGSRG